MNLVEQQEHSTLGLATYKMVSTVQKKEKVLKNNLWIPDFCVADNLIKLINLMFLLNGAAKY